MRMIWSLAAVLLAAPAAHGQAAPTAAEPHFRMGGIEITAPLPQGYCLPAGNQIDAAQLVAAGDTLNVTHLTFFVCGTKEMADDYILLKTPTQVLAATVTLPELLDGLGAAFANPTFRKSLESGDFTKDSAKSVSRALGSEIGLAGQILPIGKDDRCAYMGGTIAVQGYGMAYSLSIGMCLTVVAGKVISINWYGPDKGKEGIAALLLKTRAYAERLRGAKAD